MHDISAVDKYILCLRINLFTKINDSLINAFEMDEFDRIMIEKQPTSGLKTILFTILFQDAPHVGGFV